METKTFKDVLMRIIFVNTSRLSVRRVERFGHDLLVTLQDGSSFDLRITRLTPESKET